MSEYLKRPTQAGQISSTKSRVHTIERRLLDKPRKPAVYIAKWSLGGAIYLSESGFEVHPSGGILIRVYATLLVAGTTTTTLSFKKNENAIATLKLTNGVRFNETMLSIPFASNSDLLNVEITAAGSGADTLSVFGEFDR